MKPFPRSATSLLFADLDGTIRQGKDDLGRFVHGPEDVVIYPEAAKRLFTFRESGWRVAGVTNQGGIALGYASAYLIDSANEMTNLKTDGMFDLIETCPHHPDAEDPEMRHCFCRKPRIGMLVQAVAKLRAIHPGEFYPPELMLFVGDRPEDEACAQAAGIRFQWAKDWRDGARDT